MFFDPVKNVLIHVLPVDFIENLMAPHGIDPDGNILHARLFEFLCRRVNALVALNAITYEYDILQTVVYGLATGVGFFIAIVLLAGIREKIEYNDIPKPFQGTAIVLMASALMAIAFMGFSGMSI